MMVILVWVDETKHYQDRCWVFQAQVLHSKIHIALFVKTFVKSMIYASLKDIYCLHVSISYN